MRLLRPSPPPERRPFISYRQRHTAKATIVAEYEQSTKRTPTFGSVVLKAYTYRTPIIPVSLELLQDSAFDLDSLLSQLLTESFGRGINEHLTTGTGNWPA